MPDIGMCTDDRCPSRGICYRYWAIPSNFQNYGGIPLRPTGAKKCDVFWPACEATSELKPEAECHEVNMVSRQVCPCETKLETEQ